MEFRDMLRPVIADVAQSLEYAGEVESRAEVLTWYETASIEDLQHGVMGPIQDAILAALNYRRQDPLALYGAQPRAER